MIKDFLVASYLQNSRSNRRHAALRYFQRVPWPQAQYNYRFRHLRTFGLRSAVTRRWIGVPRDYLRLKSSAPGSLAPAEQNGPYREGSGGVTIWPYVLVGNFDNDPGVSLGKPTIIRSQSLPGHEKLLLPLVASVELSDIQAVKQCQNLASMIWQNILWALAHGVYNKKVHTCNSSIRRSSFLAC